MATYAEGSDKLVTDFSIINKGDFAVKVDLGHACDYEKPTIFIDTTFQGVISSGKNEKLMNYLQDTLPKDGITGIEAMRPDKTVVIRLSAPDTLGAIGDAVNAAVAGIDPEKDLGFKMKAEHAASRETEAKKYVTLDSIIEVLDHPFTRGAISNEARDELERVFKGLSVALKPGSSVGRV